MNIIFFINLIVCFLEFNGKQESFNENVLDISPDSKKILTLERQKEDVIHVWNESSMSTCYTKNLGNEHLSEAIFISDSEFIGFMSNKNQLLINIISGSEKSLKDLKGIHPKCLTYDRTTRTLAIIENLGDIEGDHVGMSVDLFKIDIGKLRRYNFKRSGAFIFDITFYNNETLLFNDESILVSLNLNTLKWEKIRNNEGMPVLLGESRLNITRDKRFLFFSINDKGGLATYQFSTKELKSLQGYHDLIFPILSPDETYFIAELGQSEEYEARLIKDTSFLK